jgi:hypothetical protein
MSFAAPSAGPVMPLAPQRATLEEWRTKLENLIERRRNFRGSSGRQLCVHLASAIEGAHATIAETCGPARSELLDQVIARIAPYFAHPGDARQTAANFPAVVQFHRVLRGEHGENSLDGLTRRAGRAVELIGRILGGQEFWRFEAGDL